MKSQISQLESKNETRYMYTCTCSIRTLRNLHVAHGTTEIHLHKNSTLSSNKYDYWNSEH